MQKDFGGFDLRYAGVTLKIEELDQDMAIMADYILSDRQLFPPEIHVDNITPEHALVRTVQHHECCHFFDYFLTPWGSELLRCRQYILADNDLASYIMDNKHEGRPIYLPTPLIKWFRTSKRKKKAIRKKWIEMLAFQGRGDLLID